MHLNEKEGASKNQRKVISFSMKTDLLGIVLMVRPPQNTLLSNWPVVGIELSDVAHVGHHTIDHGVP